MSASEAVESPNDYSATEPSPPEVEKLLSVSDYQRKALTGKMTKFPRLSRDTVDGEKERVTYEHMLVRYGSWACVRSQVFAYTFLLFVGFIYKAHVDFHEFTLVLHAINEGRHIHCCCEKPARAEYLKELNNMFNSRGFFDNLRYLVPVIVGLTCPLWERHISRHSVLLGSVVAGVLCSLMFLFSHTPEGLQIIHVLQNLCTTGSMMCSFITLAEILPYNRRILTVTVYMFVEGVANALATLHFHLGFSLSKLGIFMSFGYLAGIFVVIFVAQDSILHMNIRNAADVVEKVIRKKEAELFKNNPEGDIYYHTRVARKIFEDLVYLDRDEPKLINFLKRLWRNKAILEIIIAIFQSVSMGMLSYEEYRFWNERFVGPYLIGIDRILGYPVIVFTMFLLSRFHRVKAISLILAATLLVASLHHLIINFDNTNKCGKFKSAEHKYDTLLGFLNVLYYSFDKCNLALLLVHFMETAPSSLRLSSLLIIYMPFHVAKTMTPMILNGQTYGSAFVMAVYSYHVIIIVITAFRARSKLPFSLYLFDLMPASEREEDSERESSDEEPTQKPAESKTHY